MKSSITERFTYQWLTQQPLHIPITKTRLILFYLSLNYLIVFVDVLIAHALNRLFPVYEWIPVIFSPIAALSAILLFIRPKPGCISILNLFINFTGVVIGILGFGFHLQGASAGNVVSFAGLTSGNPVFAPLAFVALGSIGILTTLDDRSNSRKYNLTRKTRWLLLTTAFWFFATALVAYFDHARTGFTNLYTWIPLYMGIFAAMILLLQAYSQPERGLSILLGTTMILSFAVGLLGFAFHLSADLAGRGSILWSRVFYQAPGLAPLLFCDLGIWGILVFLDPLNESPLD
ncbi:putative membrane protein [Candidatus Desulfosporosinus infrequens]|uniref:Putative membrane protein n=1 Tax=Candidatus Desulfosporosinus infrequens TaxID=2043169 RepID=A0A2U3JYH3_9FIRM|nr:putative membrane protein [Candidatus Desulfosporosinus infrequens]